MIDQNLQQELAHIFDEFTNLAALTAPERPLHLAHYTSLEVLEKVMTNEEIWFSNPLLMNDHQEVRFGLSEGIRIVGQLKNNQDVLHILKEQDNVEKTMQAFSNALQSFDINHLFDVYVFCLSKYSCIPSFSGDAEGRREGSILT